MPTSKHIVAVAGLVTDTWGRVLTIRSPRRDWEFPGGQVEAGEQTAPRQMAFPSPGRSAQPFRRVFQCPAS